MKSMKLKLCAILLSAGLCFAAVGQQSEIGIGQAQYTAGEFKIAAAHFQLALQTDPHDADAYYWLGMADQRLADIAAPFGGRYNAKARVNLTQAVELAPASREYRRELFDFLLDSAGSSRGAWRQAEAILQTVAESDSEYVDMRRRLEEAKRESFSAEACLGRLFLAAPRTMYRIGELSQSAVASAIAGTALKSAK
jgi:tetratricopeptide (TPR) repeat protein